MLVIYSSSYANLKSFKKFKFLVFFKLGQIFRVLQITCSFHLKALVWFSIIDETYVY
jgi:hypothetical protein